MATTSKSVPLRTTHHMEEFIPNLPAFILTLETETQQHLLCSITQTIQKIMSIPFIQSHPALSTLLEEEPKRYLPFSVIFEIYTFKEHLQAVGLRPLLRNQYQEMGELLLLTIKKMSRLLWANPGGVRLLSPDSMDKVYPVCFENFDQSNNCLNFQNLLCSLCTVTNIQYNKSEGWAIAYTNEPEKLQQLDGYKWIDPESDQEYEMRVLTEQILERAKESFLQISSYLKHKEIYRTTVSDLMPCARTVKTIRVRNGTTIKDAVIEELVSFRDGNQEYQSCIVKEDRSFIVKFPESSQNQESEEIYYPEEKSLDE